MHTHSPDLQGLRPVTTNEPFQISQSGRGWGGDGTKINIRLFSFFVTKRLTLVCSWYNFFLCENVMQNLFWYLSNPPPIVSIMLSHYGNL